MMVRFNKVGGGGVYSIYRHGRKQWDREKSGYRAGTNVGTRRKKRVARGLVKGGNMKGRLKRWRQYSN